MRIPAILAAVAALAFVAGCAIQVTLGAPALLTATAGNAQVTLSWTAPAGGTAPTSYNIYYATSTGVTPANGTKISGIAGTSYTQMSLTNGTTYFYVVTAVYSSGESAASNQASATPSAPAMVPPVPLNLGATAGNAQVLLNWSASAGATSYNLYYSTTTGVTPANGTKISGIATATYTQMSLANVTTYYYVVTAVDAAGESSPSNQASATPVVPIPPAPLNLGATAGNAQVVLTWSASAGATSYNLYYSTTTGVTSANGTKISSIALATFTQMGLINGVPYFYVVTAVNAAGESGPSNQASATPLPPIPPAPLNLGATAGNAQVVLNWSASTGADFYNVYYSTSPGVTPANGTKRGNLVGTTLTQMSLTNGTTYYFVVTAVNLGGESGPSNQASATPLPPIPPAPLNLGATAGNAQVVLNWSSSAGATSYNLYYSTTTGVTPANGTKISGIALATFTQMGLTNGTTYFYVVTAVNLGGESGPSNQASATPLPPIPPAPLNLSATAGNSQVLLNWSASAGATSYNLYYSTTTGVTPANGTKISGIALATFTQMGLTNGTTYFYVVTAVNLGGESGPSNQASATPLPAIPPAPLNLGATAGNAQVALNWSASAGATSYNLYYSTTTGVTPANGTKISGIMVTTYTQMGLTAGTTYYYVVTAMNASGESGPSNQASATPNPPLVTVVGSVAVNGVARTMALYTNGLQKLAYVCSDSQVNIVDVTTPTSPALLSTFAGTLLTENGAATGFQSVTCAIDGTSLIVSYGREDGNTTSNPIPTNFATFSLANPLSPVQVGSAVSIVRPDSFGLYVQGNSALMLQSTTFYNPFSGFVVAETGDVWGVDLTNAPATGSVGFLSDLYPCGGIDPMTSACTDGTAVPTATFTGGVCVSSGTTSIANDQYRGGPYRVFPGAIVNGTTAYFASTSAYGGNVEEPACPPIAGQLLVVDSSNVSALAITTSVSVPQAAFLTSVAVQGNTALVVGDSTGIFDINSGFVGSLVIASFDISNPKNPVLLDSVVISLTDKGGATVVPLGNNTFVIGGTADSGNNPTFVKVDASAPAALTYGIFSTPVIATPEIASPPLFYSLSSTPISSTNQLTIMKFGP